MLPNWNCQYASRVTGTLHMNTQRRKGEQQQQQQQQQGVSKAGGVDVSKLELLVGLTGDGHPAQKSSKSSRSVSGKHKNAVLPERAAGAAAATAARLTGILHMKGSSSSV
jgi:hypothetical protein